MTTPKTDKPPIKLEIASGTVTFYLKVGSHYLAKTIDDSQRDLDLLQEIVTAVNAHADLVRQRDELLAALKLIDSVMRGDQFYDRGWANAPEKPQLSPYQIAHTAIQSAERQTNER